MVEVFAKPAVSAIIEKVEFGERFVLLQRRQKDNGGETNGLFEIAGGKVREYENIYDALRREVWEETGLKITEISGEDKSQHIDISGAEVISIEPCQTAEQFKIETAVGQKCDRYEIRFVPVCLDK